MHCYGIFVDSDFFFKMEVSGHITLGKVTDLNRFEPAQIYRKIFQDLHKDGGCNFVQPNLTTELFSHEAFWKMPLLGIKRKVDIIRWASIRFGV